MEAVFLRSLLEGSDIPASVSDWSIKGDVDVRVCVAQRDVERARPIVDHFKEHGKKTPHLLARCAMRIRQAEDADLAQLLAIINEAAQAYRGIIPADRWHDPYMPEQELQHEIGSGVTFWVAEEDNRLLGVMGLQDKGAVALIRHAYVAPTTQRKGVGTKLLRHVEALAGKPVLIGTWADASWAIDFYRRNGFTIVPPDEKDRLLRTYWSIPDRQIETSVVLADRRWSAAH
jgi:N-acetylglutamate synthase-like GNAT family acetyltransferase